MPAAQSRSFPITLNNPDVDAIDWEPLVDTFQAQYVCSAIEQAPTTGTEHLQAFLYFERKKTKAAVILLLQDTPWSGAHVELGRGTPSENRSYVKGPYNKNGKSKPVNPTFKEWGTLPSTTDEKDKWSLTLSLAKRGKMEEIDAGLQIRHYSALESIRVGAIKEEGLLGPCGVWISGESGLGKSRMARSFGAFFLKDPESKWVDGYSPGLNMVIEDLDKSHATLSAKLKLWADAHPFTAEKKGGVFQAIRPPLVIVTSQYEMEGIWGDEETLKALKRRFTRVRLYEDQEPIVIPRSTPPQHKSSTTSVLSKLQEMGQIPSSSLQEIVPSSPLPQQSSTNYETVVPATPQESDLSYDVELEGGTWYWREDGVLYADD